MFRVNQVSGAVTPAGKRRFLARGSPSTNTSSEGITMYMAVRPYFTAGLAIAGASVLAGAPINGAARSRRATTVRTDAVQRVSLVPVVLNGFGDVVGAAAGLVDVAARSAIDLPFDVAMLIGAANQNPAMIPDLARFLAHLYLS